MAYLYLQATGQNVSRNGAVIGSGLSFISRRCELIASFPNPQIGIGVDTHVHRITNRLRWHQKETQTAEQTRYAVVDLSPAAS